MKTLKCSAVCGTQKGRRIFTGILNAGDLIDVTTVDHYDSSKSPDHPKQGYQRPPERLTHNKNWNVLNKEYRRG